MTARLTDDVTIWWPKTQQQQPSGANATNHKNLCICNIMIGVDLFIYQAQSLAEYRLYHILLLSPTGLQGQIFSPVTNASRLCLQKSFYKSYIFIVTQLLDTKTRMLWSTPQTFDDSAPGTGVSSCLGLKTASRRFCVLKSFVDLHSLKREWRREHWTSWRTNGFWYRWMHRPDPRKS